MVDGSHVTLPGFHARGYEREPGWLIETLNVSQPDPLLTLNHHGRSLSLGLTNDRVAGLDLLIDLNKDWSVSAFGGLPTSPVATQGVLGNLVVGGRLDARLAPSCHFGLFLSRDNGMDGVQEASTDFNIKLGPLLMLSGLSRVWDDEWREHRFATQFCYRSFRFKPVFEYFYPWDRSDHFAAENHLYGFLADAEESVRTIGADVDWQGVDRLIIGLQTRRFDYLLLHEDAVFCEGIISIAASDDFQVDLNIGRMIGDLDETRFHLMGADLVYRNLFGLPGAFVDANARYIDYDRSVRDHHMAVDTSWGFGFRFEAVGLETRLSGIRTLDPYGEDDMGAMLSIRWQRRPTR
ncbi:MAG: hypothetical protein WBY88_01545 [Desulfosarcina sp.]